MELHACSVVCVLLLRHCGRFIFCLVLEMWLKIFSFLFVPCLLSCSAQSNRQLCVCICIYSWHERLRVFFRKSKHTENRRLVENSLLNMQQAIVSYAMVPHNRKAHDRMSGNKSRTFTALSVSAFFSPVAHKVHLNYSNIKCFLCLYRTSRSLSAQTQISLNHRTHKLRTTSVYIWFIWFSLLPFQSIPLFEFTISSSVVERAATAAASRMRRNGGITKASYASMLEAGIYTQPDPMQTPNATNKSKPCAQLTHSVQLQVLQHKSNFILPFSVKLFFFSASTARFDVLLVGFRVWFSAERRW